MLSFLLFSSLEHKDFTFCIKFLLFFFEDQDYIIFKNFLERSLSPLNGVVAGYYPMEM